MGAHHRGMSSIADVLHRHPALRWAAPAGAVAVVAAVAGIVAAPASADDHPVLPPRSAEQLLADTLQPTTQALSGTVALHADLGLPSIPGITGAVTGTGVVPGSAASMAPGAASGTPGTGTLPAAISSLTALASGDHTLRVWADGPQRARVAVVEQGDESDVVRNGTDLWVWHSADRQAVHATLPKQSEHGTPTATPSLSPGLSPEMLAQLPSTPQQAASMLLTAVGPTTDVSTESTASVAGRPAYQLVATPKADGSLVDRVVVSIDSATHVPLRVDVYSTQRTDAAVSLGFTDVSFATPAASSFEFTPPAGATVTQLTAPTTKPKAPATGGAKADAPAVSTVGTGWATVVVATPPAGAAKAEQQQAKGLLDLLPAVSGSWGSGHALSGTLFSVLLTDKGTVAAGAVPVATLESALTAGTGR